MAVINVKEDWRGLNARAGTQTASVPRTFTVKFDESDDPEKRPILAWGASGVPSLYASHPSDSSLYVKDKDVEAIGPFDYKVIVHYTTIAELGTGQAVSPFTLPLDQPWEIEWGFTVMNIRIDRDLLNNPILNSAGQSIDPPVMWEFYDPILRISRNESFYDDKAASDYINSINSDYFNGYPPNTARCIEFSARRAYTAGLFYWKVSYQFQFHWHDWAYQQWDWTTLARFLDEGYAKKTGSGFEVKKDDNDVVMPEPVRLDGSGDFLADGNDSVFRQFTLFKQKPFYIFNLEVI